MRSSSDDALELLRARTKVVADNTVYHARTPSAEAWCGANPDSTVWTVISLPDAEDNMELEACAHCFQTAAAIEIIRLPLEYDT